MSKQAIVNDHNTRRSQRQSPKSVSIDLQMNLLDTWTKHHVADYYQNIFLIHLDELQPALAEEKMKKEIKHTLQKNTLFYSMQNLTKQRKNLLMQLQYQLSKQFKVINSEQLAIICQKVKIVRDINLRIGETIIKMYQEFHTNNHQLINKQLMQFVKLIDGLESSVTFIKKSYLNEYITFRGGFDPFFMNNYQQIHRQNYENTKEQIKELYSINISYVYRLMKVKCMLLDIKSAYQQPFPMKKRLKQVVKFQSLPTLHTDIVTPVRVSPIKIFRSRHEKSSRTTVYPSFEGRPQSSYTEEYSRPKLKFSKVMMNPLEGMESLNKKMKKNKVYIRSEPNQERRPRRKKYQFKQFDDNRDIQLSPNYYFPREEYVQNYNNLPFRQHRYSHSQRYQNQLSKMNNIIELKPHSVRYVEPSQMKKIKNYNPIKGEHFQLAQTPIKHHRYDFDLKYKSGHAPNYEDDQDEIHGLDYETPLSKYNKKGKYYPKKVSTTNEGKHEESSHRQPIKDKREYEKAPKQYKSELKHEKIDQQCQTIQMRNAQSKPNQNQRKKSYHKQQSNKVTPNTVNKKEPKQQKPPKNKQSRDDQTIQNGEIIDERPIHLQNRPEKPLIRQVPKEPQPQSKPISSSPRKNEAQVAKKSMSKDKKQIKMKSGKYSIQQVLKLLQKSTIPPQYKALFDMQKLVQWIKASQTYITQFYINDVCVIIALCSPIPNIGMAIKLWAPVNQQANQNASMNFFARYIDFIEKSTTCEKIMFNGNGEAFKELKSCGFTMKKQKLYQRIRKTPAKDMQSQFKPFLYVQCSTVNFPQNSKEKMLFSQEIQEFSEDNCYLSKVLGEININKVPENLKPLIKITQKLPNFSQVNKILVSQCFDQYEASLIKPTNISLLRLYFNSPFKSTFIAGQGHIKLVGTLLYQKNQQCLISINTIKNNGLMYFSKNMSFQSILEKSKLVSNNKVSFTVKMFTKKLYGKLIKFAPGSYGNFEINLAFEDEMQGRIKHNIIIQRCFGPEQFTIGIQIEKCSLICVAIGKDDFIY